eukprot:3491767-Amphidinium_carterae.2
MGYMTQLQMPLGTDAYEQGRADHDGQLTSMQTEVLSIGLYGIRGEQRGSAGSEDHPPKGLGCAG